MRKQPWRRTTRPEKLARIEETMTIILQGGNIHDLRSYSQEKGWGVLDPTLWQYKRLALALIVRRCDHDRERRLAWHFASRELMLARAMEAGDLRTAHDILKDLAKLEGHYPESNHKSHVVVGVNIHAEKSCALAEYADVIARISEESNIKELPAPPEEEAEPIGEFPAEPMREATGTLSQPDYARQRSGIEFYRHADRDLDHDEEY